MNKKLSAILAILALVNSAPLFPSQLESNTSELGTFYADNNRLKNKALERDAIRYAIAYFEKPSILQGILVSFNQQLPRQAQAKRSLETQLDQLLQQEDINTIRTSDLLRKINEEHAKDILHKARRRDIVRGALNLLNKGLSQDQLRKKLTEINQLMPSLGQMRRAQEQQFDSAVLQKQSNL